MERHSTETLHSIGKILTKCEVNIRITTLESFVSTAEAGIMFSFIAVIVVCNTSVVFARKGKKSNYWLKYEIRLYKKQGEGKTPLLITLLESVMLLPH